MKRTKLGGLLRNACVVAGNTGDSSVLPLLVDLAQHPLPVVRAHAVWAVYRLAKKEEAASLLAKARETEADVSVLEEYDWAMNLKPVETSVAI